MRIESRIFRFLSYTIIASIVHIFSAEILFGQLTLPYQNNSSNMISGFAHSDFSARYVNSGAKSDTLIYKKLQNAIFQLKNGNKIRIKSGNSELFDAIFTYMDSSGIIVYVKNKRQAIPFNSIQELHIRRRSALTGLKWGLTEGLVGGLTATKSGRFIAADRYDVMINMIIPLAVL